MKLEKQKLFKMILIMLLFIMLLFCTGLNVHAEDVKDGISVTISSDKENYSSEEEVKLKITVKNTNNFEVNNIKIENILPDGISFVSGDISKDNIKLQANEEATINLTVKKSDLGQADTTETITNNSGNTEKNTTVSKSAKLPNTGDNNSVLVALIGMLVLIIVMIVFFMLKGRKKYSKFLTMLICLGVVNVLGITSIIYASSERVNNFTYEYNYKIDNNNYVHKVIVSYSLKKENKDKNNTDTEKKLQDGYVTDNLAQFKMENEFDKSMDLTKAIINNTRCEFKNVEYGEDGKGTADITVYAPDMEKIYIYTQQTIPENPDILLNCNGENLEEKFKNYLIELLNSNKYEVVKTELPITIYKENNQWIVSANSKLGYAILGNINKVLENALNDFSK